MSKKRYHKYSSWLSYNFDRPITTPEWYYTIDHKDFLASSEEYCILIKETFCYCNVDLDVYSWEQRIQGLDYLIGSSEYLYSIEDFSVSLELKLDLLESIYKLYNNYFAKHCLQKLCHLETFTTHEEIYPETDGKTDLNDLCYMFWNACPICRFECRHSDLIKKKILEILERILSIDHLACQESALHGLGHLSTILSVTSIINDFIKRNKKNLDQNLIQYAEKAKIGKVL